MVVTFGAIGSWFVAAAAERAPTTAADASFTQPGSTFEKRRPPGIDEELWCGTVTVFENRRTRTGRTIALNVVVLPALDPKNKREPLFDLAGGPGLAATSSAAVYATDMKEYRKHRDVVLVDQRGTGQSNPLTAEHDSSPQHFLSEMYPVEYVTKLRAQLEERADLTQYTTPIAMDDLDDVRAALGYERINLFGLSYGSRAAMVYLRQHPEHVRCVVLMGVAPTFQKMPLYHARDGERALNLLLDECEHDRAATKVFPKVRAELRAVLSKLSQTPARVRYSPADGPEVTVEIRRDIFAEKLRSWMYDSATSRRIPLVIHRAATGDFGPFLKMAIPANRSAPFSIADGMYLSVTTAEDMALIEPAVAEKLNAGSIFGNYRVEQQLRAASLWPRGVLPPAYAEPVVSDVPVLIFSGFQDPVTPPAWAEEVARHLSHSRHVILARGAHIPDTLSHLDCLDKVIMEFLDNADPTHLDVACLAEMSPPPFATD